MGYLRPSEMCLVMTCCWLAMSFAEPAQAAPGDAGRAQDDVPPQVAKLQSRIAQDRRLDGILLKGASYDADKKVLTVEGTRWACENENAEKTQLDALRNLVDDFRSNEWPAAREAAEVVIEPVRRLPSLAVSLRNAISRRPDLDGVRIDRHFYHADWLHLEGIRAAPRQQEILRELIAAELQPTAEWMGQVADKWRLGDLREVPIREFLRQAQEKVAAASAFDGIRFDRAHFDPDGRLTLSGIAWPEDEVGIAAPPGRTSTAGRLDTLEWRLMQFVAADWPDFVEGGQLRLELRTVESPLPLIRSLVSKRPDWDGMRIDRGFYTVEATSESDWSPKLVFTGIQPVPNAKQSNPETASEAPTRVWDPVCCREVLVPAVKRPTPGPKPERVAPRLDEALLKLAVPQLRLMADGPAILVGEPAMKLQDVDWGGLRIKLQESLRTAGRTGPALASGRLTLKARIDRIYFDQANVFRLQGIHWPEKDRQGSAADDLRAALAAELKKSPPAYEGRIGTASPSLDELPRLPSALIFMREIVAAQRDLDGVRIDNANYDGEGRLVIEVAQASERQIQRLEQLLRSQAERADWKAWTAKGWALAAQESAGFEGLKDAIIGALASQPALDGVRVDRVYYDSDLRLAFEGQRWNENQDAAFADMMRDVVRTKYQNAVRGFDGSRLLVDEPVGAGQLPARLSLTSLHPMVDLLARVRRQVSEDCELDGVRVDRAYFSTDSVLNFDGLVANDQQGKRFEELIRKSIVDDAQTKLQLSRGFSARPMHAVPMRPLVAIMQDLVAGHSKLDGVRIDRAWYAPDGRLAVKATVNNAAQKELFRRVLNTELARLDEWHVRCFGSQVAKTSDDFISVEHVAVHSAVEDELLSNQMFNAGFRCFWDNCYPQAIEKFTDSLRHQPTNLYARYYRALSYALLDKEGLARRDIRRALAVEKSDGRNHTDSQYRKILSKVQGPDRRRFEALVLAVVNDPVDPSPIAKLCAAGECAKRKAPTPCSSTAPTLFLCPPSLAPSVGAPPILLAPWCR